MVAIFVCDGGHFQRSKVEEDNDFGCGDELSDELAEDDRGGLAGFVEEDTETFYGAEGFAAKLLGKLYTPIVVCLHEVRSGEAILGFREPLLFFAESP